MRVVKRNGDKEPVSFDKVLRRIQSICPDLPGVDAHNIAQKVCSRIFDGVKTTDLDELAAQMCSTLITEHPDYGVLGARIIISNHHKNTSPSFSETITALWNATDTHGKQNALISEELYKFVIANKEKLNNVIDYQRDYLFDYFGFKTLERSYLLKASGRIVERPQHMWMRVSLGIHGDDLKAALETYDLMSKKMFTHATPTLFNAGTPRAQLASCYLISMDDSITGIYKTLGDCAQISKYAGGIGMHIHTVRSRNSHIRGTNGSSTGIIPMLRVYNATARYVNQGGKRNGSIAVYLEPWHADIESFIEIRKNHGNEEERCRDLFTAMWIPDLFMKRVQQDGDWTLMCPDECPGLSDVYGEEFEKLYEKYEAEGKYRKKMKAQQIWLAILKSQIETGTPYLLYKDAVNKKTNQKHSGVVKSSNLCTEITEISNSKETAVCNLASIVLVSYVKKDADGKPYFDFEMLHSVSRVITKNLNKVIDRTFYPIPETDYSNRRHRPIGIGVQGLADTFALMRISFDSPEAAQLNREIFETIYHGAVTASVKVSREREELLIELENPELSAKRKTAIRKKLHLTEAEKKLERWRGSYETFVGSPASFGKLQFNLWEEADGIEVQHSGRWDWEELRKDVMTYGMRNSLLLAPMPTASTSQIMGSNEAFEPFTSNIYQRRTLSGEFTIINKYLINDLIGLGLWSSDLKDELLANGGSVQNIENIPDDIKVLYKTVWEISQKVLINQSADRGVYVCQSQSLNLFVEEPDMTKLTNIHFYAWKRGLKTGIYYLRTRPRVKTAAFTLKIEKRAGSDVKLTKQDVTEEMILACSRENPEACEFCSS
jgi:ribonucleoside-diphosphate reductase alpha chain